MRADDDAGELAPTPKQVHYLLSIAATRDLFDDLPTTREERLRAMREILPRLTRCEAGILIDTYQHRPCIQSWKERTDEFAERHAAAVTSLTKESA